MTPINRRLRLLTIVVGAVAVLSCAREDPSALRSVTGLAQGTTYSLQWTGGAFESEVASAAAAELERIAYTLHAGPDDMIRHSRRHGIPIPPQPVDAPKPMDVWAATFQPVTDADHLLVDGEVLEIGRRRL